MDKETRQAILKEAELYKKYMSTQQEISFKAWKVKQNEN